MPGRRSVEPVLPGAVGHGGPDLFDEGRTGGLDGHAGEHGPGRVAHDAGNRRLGVAVAGIRATSAASAPDSIHRTNRDLRPIRVELVSSIDVFLPGYQSSAL